MRNKEIAIDTQIKNLNNYVNKIAIEHKSKLENEPVFAVYFKDIKDCVEALKNQELPIKSLQDYLKKAAGLQQALDRQLVGEHERTIHDVYIRIKKILLESAPLNKNLGSMVTVVEHADNIAPGQKLDDKVKLELLGSDALRYLDKTPRRSHVKFFSSEPIKSLTMKAQVKIKSFLETVGLITKDTLSDKIKMQEIKDTLHGKLFDLPSDKDASLRTLHESTVSVKPTNYDPAKKGAIYKRPR